MVNINAERITGGDIPVMNEYIQRVKTAITRKIRRVVLLLLRNPKVRVNIRYTIPTCSPETERTCVDPVAANAEVTAGSIDFR
jgi:hypothetical protein